MKLRAFSFAVAVFGCLFASGCGGSGGSLPIIVGTPDITGITPSASVAPGSTIAITGINLNGQDTTAYFNGVTATATGGNTTSVNVVVPSSLAQGTYNVYVITSDGFGDVSGASNTFTITVT